ncbi:MAG: fatty acid hydroxylase family protein [Deltaproteobacteria bacterium]|nr:MAG: fatty acid hydroxylase family protein [Deltaproteobacteria bacterium]
MGLGFHYVDVHDRPRWIARHRIQTGPPRRPPLPRTVRVLLVNQCILLPPLLWGMAALLQLRGWTPTPALPTLPRLLFDLAGLSACSIAVFYSTHRFLHRPWWMRRVHRRHHEFHTTTALASEYAHPVEFCVGNFLTLAAGVVLLTPSLASLYLYLVLAMLTVLFHHCGYALPWAPWSVHHDWHHHKVTEVFGTLGILDRLLGTDAKFRTLRDGEVV